MSEPNSAGCCQAARQFSKTTTLHGFKYLSSKYCFDRWGWLVYCCASACCAGMLCAVLWARFLQVPALLTLREMVEPSESIAMPLVGVCPPTATIAQLFQQQLLINKSHENRLPEILDHVLRRKLASIEQLAILEDMLNQNNVTLAEALLKVMPPCHRIVRNCRWQSIAVPCETIFDTQLTQWGVCCFSNVSALKLKPSLYTRLAFTRNLNFGLQCTQHDKPESHGCEFFTKYEGEGWIDLSSTSLSAGYNYVAQLSFTSVLDGDPDKLVDETCITIEKYSRSQCLLKCREDSCGCSDPLRINQENEIVHLPLCPITKLNCLRSFDHNKFTCKCLPSCKKVITDLVLESSKMFAFNNTFGGLYAGLNESTSTVLNIIVRIQGSKVFVVTPTETWITLLSSLGGVFNMFLGVGLFSVLEIIFLICVRCPIAIKRSSDVTNTHDAIS